MERILTIEFKAKNKMHTFNRPYNNPKVDQFTVGNWIKKCYQQLGVKSSQVTKQRLTVTGWDFWVSYSV